MSSPIPAGQHLCMVHITDGEGATVWNGALLTRSLGGAFAWARERWPDSRLHVAVNGKEAAEWLRRLPEEQRAAQQAKWQAAGIL